MTNQESQDTILELQDLIERKDKEILSLKEDISKKVQKVSTWSYLYEFSLIPLDP